MYCESWLGFQFLSLSFKFFHKQLAQLEERESRKLDAAFRVMGYVLVLILNGPLKKTTSLWVNVG